MNSIQFRNKFIEACKKGDLYAVKNLIDRGIDPSMNDDEAIQLASFHGHTEIVEYLLDDIRVNPCANYNYAIRTACMDNSIDIVRVLLSKNVDPSACFNQCIIYCCKYNHIDLYDLLIKDVRVNPFKTGGDSTILRAARHDDTELLYRLLTDPRFENNMLENPELSLFYKNVDKVILRIRQDNVDFILNKIYG